ncbi:MAG: helix-turn-helix domain-containing protein, partial [Chloroflexi bacterium]|nr:helix-turn-helix domain-containing protein [Chloroflexota bacterium]
MDDRRIGQVLRAIRQRKGWRQLDVATRARVSSSLLGRIETGGLSSVRIGKVRQVAEALGARCDTIVRWQGADLGRLLDTRHAAMHEAISGLLGSIDGWQFEPEVSFSIYGERGIIDVLAWNASRQMLLVIELKTEIVEISGLLGSMDQRRRLAPSIVERRGWNPVAVSSWVLVADSRTNRRALAAHARVLRAKLPSDGRNMRRWLRDPVERVDALSFLPDQHRVKLGRPVSPVSRVRA